MSLREVFTRMHFSEKSTRVAGESGCAAFFFVHAITFES